jgi:hypothetical protein
MALMLETSALAHICSEPELVDAARDGDDRAFEELLRPLPRPDPRLHRRAGP